MWTLNLTMFFFSVLPFTEETAKASQVVWSIQSYMETNNKNCNIVLIGTRGRTTHWLKGFIHLTHKQNTLHTD